jgi:hypothetical protein
MANLLGGLFDGVGRCLTPEAATELANLRIDPALQARLDELADPCTRGELTPDERGEYSDYVTTLDVLAILQAKARERLEAFPSGS